MYEPISFPVRRETGNSNRTGDFNQLGEGGGVTMCERGERGERLSKRKLRDENECEIESEGKSVVGL